MHVGLHVTCCYSCLISMKLNLLYTFSGNIQIPNLVKICPVLAELFHTDGQTYRHDEPNSLQKRLQINAQYLLLSGSLGNFESSTPPEPRNGPIYRSSISVKESV
jgi:hypothetical protein